MKSWLIEVMVVLMMLLLALKLVSSSVHHTCGRSHDILCTPVSVGGGVEPPIRFLKRWGGLTGSQFLEGVCWERGVTFFRRGCNFYVRNKLKSDLFNKISLKTKMFFAVIT